jgi:F-type H+-transporting ATPase subunit b
VSFLISHALAAEATHAAAESARGIGALGIDGRIILFQLLNFAVLLFILYKIAYRPILKVLEDRREKIEHSLSTASKIEARQKELEVHHKQILDQARNRAQSIIEESQKQAKQVITAAEERAINRSEQLVTEAQNRIEQSIQIARTELRQEVIDLVAFATEQVLKEKIDLAKDADLIKKSLAQVKTDSQ